MVRNLAVEVDGLPIANPANLESLRAPSAVFSLTLPADNIFDLTAGTRFSPAVSDGYPGLLKPLGAGPHDVRFHGSHPRPVACPLGENRSGAGLSRAPQPGRLRPFGP